MLETYYNKEKTEAGVDEAGRGCYAGPVFAAAVILPQNFYHPQLNDSKKISSKTRALLRPIIESESIAFAVGMVDNSEIDQINILQASYKAMHIAIKKLSILPELLLIDGNRFKPFQTIPHVCIVKGDGKFAAIAAASILAKTYRDDYMNKLHQKYSMYSWNKNKGYGTLSHRNAIKSYGLSEYHRKSFNINPTEQLLF